VSWQWHPPRIEPKGRARTQIISAALLAPLLRIAIDAGADPRERISCTARDGCLFGKDSRKAIAGLTCHNRRSHARSYYPCTPDANG